ncbi:MAG: 6,7-dimethyl-8-ribityllumazine synthase [Alphaproteobacteria bacterium]|nr:6,7-dimethyl-8-ribityllumazine synthase [Alphaproteobacteria bacterium]
MTTGPHIMIVEARFYPAITDELVRGALGELERVGASHERVAVPGVFELPGAIRYAIRALDLVSTRKRFDGYVALGCVIRGETSHYDIVCTQHSRALMDLVLTYSIALGYGVLTCENADQAWERAAVAKRNKGAEATRASLAMIEAKRHFGFYPR